MWFALQRGVSLTLSDILIDEHQHLVLPEGMDHDIAWDDVAALLPPPASSETGLAAPLRFEEDELNTPQLQETAQQLQASPPSEFHQGTGYFDDHIDSNALVTAAWHAAHLADESHGTAVGEFHQYEDMSIEHLSMQHQAYLAPVQQPCHPPGYTIQEHQWQQHLPNISWNPHNLSIPQLLPQVQQPNYTQPQVSHSTSTTTSDHQSEGPSGTDTVQTYPVTPVPEAYGYQPPQVQVSHGQHPYDPCNNHMQQQQHYLFHPYEATTWYGDGFPGVLPHPQLTQYQSHCTSPVQESGGACTPHSATPQSFTPHSRLQVGLNTRELSSA